MKLNNSLPKVSVIVPVYGEDEYLPSCIESICNQTYENIEIILVDDGSPDKCPIICDSYAKEDSRIKVIHKINSGLVEARKTGIRMATGFYILYVDGDDKIENNYIERLVNIALKEDVDVVVDGFSKHTNGKIRKYFNSFKVGKYEKEKLDEIIFPNMISYDQFYSYGIFTYVWSKLFKKSLLMKNQLSVPSQLIVGEDSACVYPTILEANSIYVADICGYFYRQRAGSLLRMKKNDQSMLNRLVACYRYMYNRFNEMNVDKITNHQLSDYVISQLLMLSDCIVEIDSTLPSCFPFLNIKPNDKVIIYSAGAFGKHLYSQFTENKCCKIVALCDPDNEYLGSEVLSLEDAIKNEYDEIVVASIDRTFIDAAVKEIKEMNVPLTKIITIDDSKDFIFNYCEKLLKR